jgi:hypothetical protein
MVCFVLSSLSGVDVLLCINLLELLLRLLSLVQKSCFLDDLYQSCSLSNLILFLLAEIHGHSSGLPRVVLKFCEPLSCCLSNNLT